MISTQEPPVKAGALSVEPVGGCIGAEVSGVDLAGPLSDAVIAEIETALVAHKVLFFRDQQLTPEQHIGFGRRFGPLEVHPFQGAAYNPVDRKYPEFFVLESTPENPKVAEHWHSDVTWRQTPSMGSILRMTHAPQSGGDTRWADMTAAYDSLDDATRSRISGMTAIHDWGPFRQGMRSRGVPEERIAALEAEYPPAEHPVVRTHPVSGRKLIYVNGSFTVAIKGMKAAESTALLQRLYALADIPDIRVELSWRPGTVAFWDNRGTQHSVTNDVVGHRRMERVTVCGDKPF